jgi:predicted dehydrogenase
VLPRRRLEVLGETGMLVATDTMGQTPGGSLVRRCGRSGDTAPVPFDALASPFARQAAAFELAAKGGAHDFSPARDLDLMRLFDCAYREAIGWL